MTLHNRERGILTVEANGRSYTLVLDLNALVMAEGHFSTPAHHVTLKEIGRHIDNNSMTHTRVLMWAAFRRHHPDVTEEAAGEIIWGADVETFNQHVAVLMRSLRAAPADLEALDADAPRPPQASPESKPAPKRTTGGASISPRAVAG